MNKLLKYNKFNFFKKLNLKYFIIKFIKKINNRMPYFINFDNFIIVIDDNIIIDIFDIFDMKTKKQYKKIGSQKNKYFINKIIKFEGYEKNNIFDDLIKLHEHYKVDYDIFMSGIYRSYYDNKQIKEEYYHINYKKEGEYNKYDRYGKNIKKCNYVNNVLNGYYMNITGSDKFESKYENGKLNGNFIMYNNFMNRCRKFEGSFENNTLIYCNIYSSYMFEPHTKIYKSENSNISYICKNNSGIIYITGYMYISEPPNNIIHKLVHIFLPLKNY